MGVDADQWKPLHMEQAQSPLSGKPAVIGTAWHIGRLAQKEVEVFYTRVCSSVENDIVLPETRGGVAPSDVAILG